MTQLIIGIGHKARHGKDSFARAVEDYYSTLSAVIVKHIAGNSIIVQRTAFANALRKEVNDFLASPYGKVWVNAGMTSIKGLAIDSNVFLPDWVVPDPNPEITADTPLGKHSKLLQWWGTEYRRAQDAQYWVKKWKASVWPTADIVIVSDMRFLNEAAAIRENNGFTVNVTRLNQDGTRYIDPSRSPSHPSETELDGYNYDAYIMTKDAALTGEFAVTLVHYLRALKGK